MIYTHQDLVKSELKKFIADREFNNVLEIGAGGNNNPNAIGLSELFKNYTGIDKEATENGVKKMDAHSLEFDNETFDLIILSHTFEHLFNPLLALSEIKRVLKKNGIVWIATPYPCESQINADFDHLFVMTPIQMKKLLNFIGFNTISYVQYFYGSKPIPREHDFNVITIGVNQ